MKFLRVRVIMILTFFILSGFLTGCNKLSSSDQAIKINTEYKAVFLDNGQAFFGQIEEMGPSFVVLKDIYYVQSQVLQEGDKKEVKNTLIKRGNEWHAPDLMYINRQHILVIEPVKPDSRVDQLIKAAKTQKPEGKS
jgi:hypothetical protein